MIPQTDKSPRDYRALNQNWSYRPTLAGRAIMTNKVHVLKINRKKNKNWSYINAPLEDFVRQLRISVLLKMLIKEKQQRKLKQTRNLVSNKVPPLCLQKLI